MKKIYKSLLAIICTSTMLSGCTSYFDDMNKDPNKPLPGIDPKFQFTYAQSRSITTSNLWQNCDQTSICHFAEYAANDPLSASDYSIDARYIQDYWDLSYRSLANFNSIIRENESNAVNVNIVQMSKIWKAWLMLRLTDYLGDIPYSEAANAEASLPKYDTQKDIYYLIFDELKDAASKLDANSINIGTYDLVFAGNVNKWKVFANSLRLRMAMRIADIDPAKAKAEAASAVADGVMSSASDAAFMAMAGASAETQSKNPINYHAKQGIIHMSTTYYRIVDNFGGIDWPNENDQKDNKNITNHIVNAAFHPAKVDPRAPIQFEPSGIVEVVANPELFGNWNGTDPGNISSGIGASMVNGQNQKDFAKIGEFYYNASDKPFAIMKFSEVCFLKAIAVEKGFISGDAKSFYEAGVKDNMAEFAIPDAVVSAYLASTDANYYGTTPNYDDISGNYNTALDKILTQKWLSHFVEGSWEAWADHRQYHKPTFMPFENVSSSVFVMNASDKANNTPNAYIKRGYYPSSEEAVNKANLDEAIARMGSNSIQNNVWWDVK